MNILNTRFIQSQQQQIQSPTDAVPSGDVPIAILSHRIFKTRNDVVAQSNSYDLVDLTSVQAPSVGYQHYSVFTPKPLQPAANKLPSLASSRQKGGGGANSNIRVGKNC